MGGNVSRKLSITDNGDTLTADNTSNKLNSRYKICCINCRLTPKAIGRNFGGHVAATGYLGIQEIELSSIPPKAVLTISIPTCKISERYFLFARHFI